MMKTTLIVLLSTILMQIHSAHAKMQRGTITSCAYQAGTAYQIQNIRQVEGDDWDSFEANIKQIYADSQGRDDMLAIAKRVFFYPADKSLDFIHDEILNSCIARQQGTEPQF